ncbi:hypothetical protein BV898_08254 [Hypsibius exemplaris]|uniref:Uncharacterized protein n=1 Tax=Hypsibius exemplaris TaxID=2072580 RepID=A0A1W0WR00_HYPEX|nr:hypothetical protein BV898_08254 [Hypsibius exemplaris]
MDLAIVKSSSNPGSTYAGSDSGVGHSYHSSTRSPRHSLNKSPSQASSTSQPEQEEQLFKSFNERLWHGQIPADFFPTPENQLHFSALWQDTTKIETWLLEQMATPSVSGKPSTDLFFQDLKLFTVRAGPPVLLSALLNLGLIQSGEQLRNGLSAFQTAAMWRNEDGLRLFGHPDDPQIVYRQLEADPDTFEYFRELCPLDCWAFHADSHVEEMVKHLQTLPFNFDYLTILLRVGASLSSTQREALLGIAIAEGSNVCVDLLVCMFGANVNTLISDNGKTCLHTAATKGYLKMVELLLQRGANPNAATIENELPEDLSPREMRKEMMNILEPYRKRRFQIIQNKLISGDISAEVLLVPGDFATTNERGNGILQTAVEQGSLQSLEYLLKVTGCPINAQNCLTGRSVLADAASMGGRGDVVKVLLECGVKPGIRDFDDLSALDIAVERDDLAVVKGMMTFRQCWTGLHLAMRRSKSAAMTAVLQAAFRHRQEELVGPALLSVTAALDPNSPTAAAAALAVLEPGDLINTPNGQGELATFLAAKNGRTDSLEVIVELGGNFWSRHPRTLQTTLHVAAAGGFADTLKFLAQCFQRHRRVLDLNSLDDCGKTPLHRAAEEGHTEALRTLLELGASVNGYFRDGVLLTSQFEATQSVLDEYRIPRQIMLFRAIEKGSMKTLKAVWESHFDHYLRNHIGDTPIMVAAQLENMKILDFLLASACQEYRPYELDLNIQHDANVEAMLHRKETRPDLAPEPTAFPQVLQSIARHRLNSYQWIFGRVSPALQETVPTLCLDEHRLNHTSSVNLSDGCCAVHRVIEVGDNVDAVKRLAEKDPYCLNIPEHNGFTALHLAIIMRRTKITRFLLKQSVTDFYATDLLGRMPEELADTPRLLEQIRNARTTPESWWAAMCDEEIPLSTADGLSNWTNQFKSVQWGESAASGEAFSASAAQISLFAGKTSVSQDGVYEYMDRSRGGGGTVSKKSKTGAIQWDREAVKSL